MPIAAAPIAMAAGIAMGTIVSINSPPLAIVNMIVSVAAAVVLAGSPLIPGGVEILSMALLAYSIAGARSFIAAGRKRLLVEAQARKAQNFVDEFETAAAAGFGKPIHSAPCPMSRSSSPTTSSASPRSCSAASSPISCRSTTASESTEERKTLGFHLSARFPFSDVVVRPASEQDVHWSLSGNPIFDERGRFLGFRGIGTDLTEQRRSEREITRLARFDSLTGLPNRAMMRQTLEEALRNAAHRQKGCALFMIDLDRFKNVNDTLGHPIGDALLRQVADRLKSVMGNHGQVGRLGGDEFQAVLPGTRRHRPAGIARADADRAGLASLCDRRPQGDDRRIRRNCHRRPGRASADALVRNADLALYAAKAAGRGKHRFYEPSMHSEAAERQLLENDLRQAIERGELSVALPADRSHAPARRFPASKRWSAGSTRPAAPISPDEVHAARRGGRTDRQDRRMGAPQPHSRKRRNGPTTCASRSTCRRSSSTIPTVVEWSARHLERNRRPRRAAGARDHRRRVPRRGRYHRRDLRQIEEARRPSRARRFRHRLQLARLFEEGAVRQDQDRPELRPRRRFDATNRNAAIIRAIVTLAETLGMDTCAEGVETHDDLQLIRELGVSMVQGYIFGRPSAGRDGARARQQRHGRGRRFQCSREPRHRLMRRAITVHRRRDGRGQAAQHLIDGRAGRMRPVRSRRGPSSRSTSSASARSAASSAGRSRASSGSSSASSSTSPASPPRKRSPNDVDDAAARGTSTSGSRLSRLAGSANLPAAAPGPCRRNRRNRRSTSRSAPPSDR